MNHFLNIDYWSYGQKVLYGIMSGRDWMENRVYFPRIVYCDFAIRYLGDNNANYTVIDPSSTTTLLHVIYVIVFSRFNVRCL
jgi:hypothetical protein